MTPVYHFVAWSGTGKTTYLEQLTAALKTRGLRVALVKHDAHGLELDRPGKDTWRFARAGADVVAACDGDKFAVFDYRPADFDKILEQIRDVDIILVEGWRAAARPENTVGVYRAGAGKLLKIPAEQCAAVVGDVPLPDLNGTPFFPLDDPEMIIDFLRK